MQIYDKKNPSFGTHIIRNKLSEEISMLKGMQAKIDPLSTDPGDRWAIMVYQKVIERREKLASILLQ